MGTRMFAWFHRWTSPRVAAPEQTGTSPHAVAEALASIVVVVTDTGRADGVTGLGRHILQMRRRHQLSPLVYGSRLTSMPQQELLERVRAAVAEQDLARTMAYVPDASALDRRRQAWRYLESDGAGGSTR